MPKRDNGLAVSFKSSEPSLLPINFKHDQFQKGTDQALCYRTPCDGGSSSSHQMRGPLQRLACKKGLQSTLTKGVLGLNLKRLFL